MKLLKSGASPFVRKVMVTLHETGQLQDVELVEVKNSALAPDATVAAANPAGKIPTLVRPDGPALYDSRVICRYLDHRAQAGLYPDSRLWDVLTLEASADALLEAAVLMTYERRLRPEHMVFEDWIEAQWAKVDRILDTVNARWLSHLHGPLDMSHIGIACGLAYLDFRHDDRQWRRGRDGLATWFETFAQRESMTATAP